MDLDGQERCLELKVATRQWPPLSRGTAVGTSSDPHVLGFRSAPQLFRASSAAREASATLPFPLVPPPTWTG